MAPEHAKPTKDTSEASGIGRDGGIRTHDPLTPSQVRYQAALHPDVSIQIRRRAALGPDRVRAFQQERTANQNPEPGTCQRVARETRFADVFPRGGGIVFRGALFDRVGAGFRAGTGRSFARDVLAEGGVS